MPVEYPYIVIGQIASALYFSVFLALFPLAGWVENKLLISEECSSSSASEHRSCKPAVGG